MAFIPDFEYKASTPASTAAVSVQPYYAGQEYAPLGQIGDVLQDFSSKLLMERKQARDVDWANTQDSARRLELLQYSQQLKKTLGGDYAGYTKAMTDKVSQISQEDQQNAPSEQARQIYLSRTRETYTGSILGAATEEANQFALNLKSKTANQWDANTTETMIQGFDPQRAISTIHNMEQQAYGSPGAPGIDVSLGKFNTEQLLQEKGQDYQVSAIKAWIKQARKPDDIVPLLQILYKQYDTGANGMSVEDQQAYDYQKENLDKALARGDITQEQYNDFLSKNVTSNSNPTKQTISYGGMDITPEDLTKYIKPPERQALIDLANRQMKVVSKTNDAETKRLFNDFLVTARNGIEPEDMSKAQSQMQLFQTWADQKRAAGKTSEADTIETEMKTSFLSGTIKNSVPYASNEELSDPEALYRSATQNVRSDSPFFVGAVNDKTNLGVVKEEAQRALKERADDPVLATTKVSPQINDLAVKADEMSMTPSEFAKYRALTRQVQKNFDPETPESDVKILTNNQAATWVNAINNAKNTKARADLVQQIFDTTASAASGGSDFVKVLDEMHEADPSFNSKEVASAMINADPIVKQKVLAAAFFDKKNFAEIDHATYSTLKKEVLTQTTPLVQAYTKTGLGDSSSPSIDAKAVQDTIEKMSMADVQAGSDPKEAVANNIAIYNRMHDVVQVNKSNLLYPKAPGVDPNAIKSHLEEYQSTDGLQNILHVKVPDNNNAFWQKFLQSFPEAEGNRKAAFYSYAKDHSYWATEKDGVHAQLKIVIPVNGVPSTSKGSQAGITSNLVNERGAPIETNLIQEGKSSYPILKGSYGTH